MANNEEDLADLLAKLDEDEHPEPLPPGASTDSINPILVPGKSVAEFVPTAIPETVSLDAIPEPLDPIKILAEHDAKAAEIYKKIASDRLVAMKAVDLCFERVENKNVQAVYVESLVAAIKTLSDTSNNEVRVLDSRTRLLGALKPAQAMQTTNVQVNQGDLAKLLEQPVAPDEDG